MLASTLSLRAVGPATILSHKCDILSLLKNHQIVRDNRLPVLCRHLASRRHRTAIPVATQMSLPPVCLPPGLNAPVAQRGVLPREFFCDGEGDEVMKCLSESKKSRRFIASSLRHFLCFSLESWEGLSLTLTVSHSHLSKAHSLRIYPYPMVWPLPRPWSETMVSIPL